MILYAVSYSTASGTLNAPVIKLEQTKPNFCSMEPTSTLTYSESRMFALGRWLCDVLRVPGSALGLDWKL